MGQCIDCYIQQQYDVLLFGDWWYVVQVYWVIGDFQVEDDYVDYFVKVQCGYGQIDV